MSSSIPYSLIQKLTQPSSSSSSLLSRTNRLFHHQSPSTSIHPGQTGILLRRSISHRFSHSQPSSSHQEHPSISLNQTRNLEISNSNQVIHQSISSVNQNNLKLPRSSSSTISQPSEPSHEDILINSLPTSYNSSSSTTTTASSSSSLEPPSFEPHQTQRETTSSAPNLTQQSPTKAPTSQVKRTTRTSKPAKQVINLTPRAIGHLSTLLDGPNPKLIRIGVKNKGCAGMAYNLDYVDQPGKFDEVVVTKNEEGKEIKVLIDSRALFSIIGSTMDWQESKLGNKFVFDNPNIKEECGCGESFLV
ncbi:Iron-sulfur assembly protein 1 [Puccinia graminis f. sp. tritici]|uniref:Iron-sulfur assembly protein 1 n=1 Tax=Puccinia graminis f. sp. tritici TaxID=56615 RepID=A0A5B0PYS0_PUCGR|nr:Iron-sulfur assembly protein 1 [Puccinia graminis f. sp. tritici]KAA1120873.1 Iron-sulfur assembly protein 1 [Puccinia graminis f. sp. tritici]